MIFTPRTIDGELSKGSGGGGAVVPASPGLACERGVVQCLGLVHTITTTKPATKEVQEPHNPPGEGAARRW